MTRAMDVGLLQVNKHVTERSRPDLKWERRPKGFWVVDELLRSDAFRSLTKMETDIFLFAMTERKYPSQKNKKSAKLNYWNPLNGRRFKLSYKSIQKFFSHKGYSPPSVPTIGRAFKKFMDVGLLALIEAGGNGPGRMNVYRIAHNWRTWKRGDAPCFVVDGMSRDRGFCHPGSGEWASDESNQNWKRGSVLNDKGAD